MAESLDAGISGLQPMRLPKMAELIAEHDISSSLPVVVRGAGGMAKAVVAAFRDAGFGDLTVVARNEITGTALALAALLGAVGRSADRPLTSRSVDSEAVPRLT